MSDVQTHYLFQAIRRQLTALQTDDSADWDAVDAAFENLQVSYEQIQTTLEAIEATQEELVQQKQHYYDLFQFLPVAALITDANGLIVEVNQAIAHLLNVSPDDLVGMPLAMFVAERDQADFQAHLNRLSQSPDIQIWQARLCPRQGDPVAVEFHGATTRDASGRVETLRFGLYNLSYRTPLEPGSAAKPHPDLRVPSSLNGLRVLVVDDEVDARECIIAVLESYGIHSRAAASALEALEELERFRPDVLLSDIRMPDGDGYSLIRQIRALEAEQGRHLPAAAITAYLDEDREKAIAAGFEAHLHKLAQPTDWVEMVAELAGQSSGRRYTL